MKRKKKDLPEERDLKDYNKEKKPRGEEWNGGCPSPWRSHYLANGFIIILNYWGPNFPETTGCLLEFRFYCLRNPIQFKRKKLFSRIWEWDVFCMRNSYMNKIIFSNIIVNNV